MKYTRVKRAVSAVVIDGADSDANPDFVKVNGNVTFTPLLKAGDVVQYAGPKGPESLVLAPIECRISDGIIMHRGQEGVYLVAGGEGVQPDVIQWKATFSNMQAGGWAFTLKPVMFDAVPGGEVDLTLVSPIAGASEPIVRGPAGVGLKSITVEGSELVVTVTSEAGTYVMSRIPLEDVVRAEADQAVASVQAAIKADADKAVESAAAAKESEDAAAKSASDAQNAASETVATAQAAIKDDVAAAAKSASDAQTAASKTVESAQSAIRTDVDAAAASASAAQVSAATATTQAETATTQAGTATKQANAAAMSADSAKASEANAKDSEKNAGASAATAVSEANRAKTEADRAAQKATETANSIEGNYSPVGHRHVWSDIDNKPAAFPPSAHTHPVGDVEGLQAALDGKAAVEHTHTWDEVTGKPDLASTWEQVKDKPEAFPTTWDEVKGKPAAFPPEAHTHTTAQVTGLDAHLTGIDSALAAKSDKGHTHTTAQVTGLDAALAGKADKGHRHKVEDVDGLKERLDQQDAAAKDVYASLIEARRVLSSKADEYYVKSQIASTRSYVDRAVADGSKIKVVSSLPSYPDSSTVYIVV
ncbi:hypothetical protein ACL1CN_10290 [Corynebacterium striatum]|nr:hypothetical protein [Corynebacterium striatum]HCG3151706.1 hypothetical protein [Corynebacterium striatum]HCG3154454.1 hypothetical protein [Corynebacterium striatum]HCG3157184.1 hypothetical protein [Corynebacterium striatum]HCG3165089.1 hypothetical protein [Corynebacterium striatum]